jgi:lysophospholipase L1-like esterase
VINLGFSGNGRLEKPLADLLAETDPAVFVLDCFPNLVGFPADTVRNRLIATVKVLQQRHPGTPVLIVEHADAAIGSLDSSRDAGYNRVNATAREAFTELKAAGTQHIYLLPADKIGLDIESTVDGTHPSDAGMEQYASAYAKAIRDILHEPTGQYATMQPCIQFRDRSYDWDARHIALLKMNKENPPAVVFLGNSITQRWGGGPGKAAWEKYFAPAGARSFGFGADRIENVLWRVYHGELDGYQAKQVILLIGTNNFGPSTDAEILAGLQLLVRAIKERQPSAKLLLLGIFPRKNQEQRVAALNGQIVQLCGSENINYADPGTLLLDASGKIKPSFFSDAVHPSAAAYQVLSKALLPYLRR